MDIACRWELCSSEETVGSMGKGGRLWKRKKQRILQRGGGSCGKERFEEICTHDQPSENTKSLARAVVEQMQNIEREPVGI